MQRRVGNESAVPIVFAVDFGGGKAGRQRAAGDDVLRAHAMGGGVETGEVSGPHVHRADAEPHEPGIEEIEVHQPLERGLERSGVVVADPIGAAAGPQRRRRQTRTEKMRRSEHQDVERPRLIDQAMG